MSAQEVLASGVQDPVDQNAQAAEDAKNLLAELQAENGAEDKPATSTEDAVKEAPSNDDAAQGVTESREAEASEQPAGAKKESDSRDRRDGRGGRRGGFNAGRGAFKNYKDNIKSDLTSQEKTDDPVAIRKQVEFYFSDSNLPMDKFLLEKVGGSKNNAVELSILHSFKRMRRFEPFEAIVEALKESTILDLTDDNTKVKRKVPLPEILNDPLDVNAVRVFEDKAMPRSIYAKGFGEEVPSTQFDIEAFFAPHGPTNAIRLRRSDQKSFKGSVFVEFETEELATKFLELDPKPQYNGKDLQIMSKKEYCDKKVDDIKAGRIKPGKDRVSSNKDQRGGRGGRRDDRKRDDQDWRQRRDEDRKNGFRDNKRHGGRGGRGGRGGGGDRGRNSYDRKKEDGGSRVEKDERGIPVIKETQSTDRDTAKASALANAKAAVDSENKKRSRGDDDGAAADAPATKKVDVKD